MWRNIGPAFRLTLVMTALTGFLYPGLVTGLCRVLFPTQSRGSLIVSDGQLVGSELIGQDFTGPEYFHPRPSAAGSGYDPLASGGSNLGPANPKLRERVKDSISKFRDKNGYHGPVPADIATASASGLDPHISPAAAEAQAPRVAHARGVPLSEIARLIAAHTEGRTFGFLGEPRINVLLLNLELDRRFPVKR